MTSVIIFQLLFQRFTFHLHNASVHSVIERHAIRSWFLSPLLLHAFLCRTFSCEKNYILTMEGICCFNGGERNERYVPGYLLVLCSIPGLMNVLLYLSNSYLGLLSGKTVINVMQTSPKLKWVCFYLSEIGYHLL